MILLKSINVTPRTVRQQVVEFLRAEILRGNLRPGDRVVEADVAANLNISRGPVREAIRQLEQEGLVTYNPHKGCSVTTLDPGDIWEIYLMRAELEKLSLTICGGDVGDDALERMRAALVNMRVAAAAKDLAALVEEDHNFHSEICKAAQAKRLLQMWSSLNNTSYAIFLTVTAANIRSYEEIAWRHQEVLDAVATKTLVHACEAVQNHYLATGRKLFHWRQAKDGQGGELPNGEFLRK